MVVQRIGIILAISQLVLFCTGYLVAPLTPKWKFSYYTNPGTFYWLFVAYFFFYVAYSFYLMITSLKTTNETEKRKRLFLITATSVGYMAGSTAFLLVYDDRLPPYGILIFLLFPIITTYGIIRHRLLDVEVIIKRTLVFAGLFTMVMTITVLMTTIAQKWLDQYAGLTSSYSAALGIILAMSLYDPTRKFLVNITDRFLFQKQFKLSTIVAQASYAIAFVQSLKWLSRRIVAFLVLKCRIKHAVVYVRSEQSGNFVRSAVRGLTHQESPPGVLYENHMVIRYLYESRSPIEIRRLEELIEKSQNHLIRTGLQVVMEFLKTCHAEVIIPSFLRRRITDVGIGKEATREKENEKDEEIVLRNILLLGAKKSDEPYSDEDLDVFYSLAQESAIAIENARLYDEAVKRTQQLAEMNRELGEINEKLQVTQASLIVAEKNATMVGMAQAIGHEVNNPLTTVLMRTDIVYKDKIAKIKATMENLKEKITEEEYQKAVKTITSIEDDIGRASRAAHRINAVVRTLTDILRDTKGEMSALSLRVIFHEAIEATRFSTYEENLTGCDIKLEVASNVMIRGNLEQLLQVFVNLIKNSYEAMENKRDRWIHIRGDVDPDNDKMAKITLTDNGPGIAADMLPKIWAQGFSTKARKDNSLGAAGQGQGLFVCKHMIESVHRGSISCESQVGLGTTFIIKLPLADMELVYAERTAR